MGRLRQWLRRLRNRPKRRPTFIGGEPPYEEPALVPRRPRPKPGVDSVSLELPDEPDDVDARGRDVG